MKRPAPIRPDHKVGTVVGTSAQLLRRQTRSACDRCKVAIYLAPSSWDVIRKHGANKLCSSCAQPLLEAGAVCVAPTRAQLASDLGYGGRN